MTQQGKTRRRSVALLAGGSTAGQLITFGLTPLISRLYTPDDFAVLTVISTIALTLGIVSALRFDAAIPLPKRDQDAYSLVHLGLLATLIITTTGVIIALTFRQPISIAFGIEALSSWLWVAPVSAGAMGTYVTLSQLAIRRQDFRPIGTRNVMTPSLTSASQLAFGTGGLQPGGLPLGYLVGQLAGALSMAKRADLQSMRSASIRSPQSLKKVARRYRRFPLVLAPSALINSLGTQLPIVLIALSYAPAEVGSLGLAQRVLYAPVVLVGVALSQVYLSELSRSVREGGSNIVSQFVRTSAVLAVAGFVVALVLLVAGPQLFSTILGHDWEMSGRFAQLLAAAIALQLIASPLSQTLIVAERTALQFGWDLSRLLLTTGAVALCIMSDLSAEKAVLAFSLSTAAAYVLSWLMSYSAVRRLRATHP
ncbi:O-antigen/teichoic acid export membrane protein [Georgenia soli]|uniref:O-antigen/teichoic acid export membrane protein n=1 Tax=Georgenia soli TaxID=638953 RepID=A0A2A9EJM6_9MICO|nr:O-antigen/teichoic acid export membrane protein [Georgenia soli]